MKTGSIFFLFIFCGTLLGGRFALQAEGVTYSAQVQEFSETQEFSDSTKQLQEVTITQKQLKEVIPAQKLSGEALQQLSSHSVADAVRYFSGIQIKDYGGVGGLKTVDVRSLGSNHVGIFYDGIQLGNAQNGQIDLGKFSLDNLEEIALYNGQRSEVLQPAKDFGTSATIYLQTRRPQFAGSKNYNLQGVLRSGSFALVNPSFLWEQKITNNISSSLNAEYIYSSGKYKFRYRNFFPDGTVANDTTAIRQNGDINALRVEGGVYGKFNVKSGSLNDSNSANASSEANSWWNIKAYFYNSERGIPGAIVDNVWKRSQRQWDRNFFVQGKLQSEITNWFKILANAKYANDYMRYLNPDTTLMLFDNRFTQQETYASIAAKFTLLPMWDISLASDFQWNALDANLQNFTYPQRYTTLLALSTSLQIWKFKLQANMLGTLVDDKISASGKTSTTKKHAQKITPAIFLSFQPVKKQDFHIRIFYKKIFRMPTFNELYYADIIDNTSLKPEYTTQYNAGIYYNGSFKTSKTKHQLTLQTDAYYNEVKDKIIASQRGNLYRWMIMNIGFVKILGLDVKAQYTIELPHNIALYANINYTYQQARDFTDPKSEFYKGQIAYIPHHNTTLTSGISYKTWNLNYCFIYVGERYSSSANINENYQLPWYTSDLSLSKDFKFKTNGKSPLNLNISAEINNLFNQQFEIIENYPMPGINFKLICKVKF